jgi:anti-sigma regulatory factor (Ser/Thr protein kinase)
MPKNMDDGRLDGYIEIISTIRAGRGVELSFKKTKEITPAGYALLFILLDVACEQKVIFKVVDFKKTHNLHSIILRASELNKSLNGFYNINQLNIQTADFIVYGKSSSIAPEFIENINQKFGRKLSEDLLWDVSLIVNELMQNTVDHSTAERYYLYAGISEKNFEFGILDMGVTIPAKLETKYSLANDKKYLSQVFTKGFGTRRDRPGGMGLYYLFENIKDLKGRLVILSRDAQVRLNFATRNYKSSDLKKRLSGTWCMANFPLE